MNLDRINLNQLRVFTAVYRAGSMTEAARELRLTQSGVSQHIQALEGMLETPLFDRIRQRLVPTPASHSLFEHASRALDGLERGLESLRRDSSGSPRELRGRVTVGMPIEFGNNLVVPRLAQFARKHPGVSFQLRLGFASDMNRELLKGAMDFAFVDEFRLDPEIAAEKVYDETLDLCIAEDALKSAGRPKLDAAYFERLDYVEYAAGEPLLRRWLSHHLGARVAQRMRLRVRANVMDVQGLARLIAGGAGAGILPSHLAARLTSNFPGEGFSLHRFKGKGTPLANQISLAWLRDRTQSAATQALMESLRASFRGTGQSPPRKSISKTDS